MRMLAIECATEACSLALFEGDRLLDCRHEILGRGHAERLVPLIASLPDKGRAADVRVSLGPGSFTGIRIGLAAARALGLAWGANVTGYPTLALVAAMARRGHPGAVTVCMAGGHGEWFVQDFNSDGLPEDNAISMTPDSARERRHHGTLAGNRASAFAASSDSAAKVLDGLPDASAVLAVPQTLLRENLAPIYGRGPDANRPL
jgi:tRNA threonylcarbamoyl adenosine modification protein YeaZ